MWLKMSALPVPGPCASRMTVPSSMFQSTSASTACNSPCASSALSQPRRSPKATGVRSTAIWSLRVCSIVLYRSGLSHRKPFRGRRDLGDEVAHETLVGERRQRHLPRLKPRRAGIDRRAVELHHAFLAGIGIDAGEADGEARVAVGANPAQPVENGLAWLEWNVEALPMACRGVRPAPDLEPRMQAHCAAAIAAPEWPSMMPP